MGRCLLIDFDGVIRVWDAARDAEVERRYAVPRGCIAAAAFGDGSALHSAVTGRITDDEWRADIAAQLAPLCGDAAQRVVSDWSEYAGAIDDEALAVVRTVRRAGWRVGLLTNATTRLAADLTVLGLGDEFDVVISSAELGLAKPDPQIYQQACLRMDEQPGSCVFVDDDAANVAAAERVGLDAHLYDGPRALAQVLGSV